MVAINIYFVSMETKRKVVRNVESNIPCKIANEFHIYALYIDAHETCENIGMNKNLHMNAYAQAYKFWLNVGN